MSWWCSPWWWWWLALDIIYGFERETQRERESKQNGKEKLIEFSVWKVYLFTNNYKIQNKRQQQHTSHHRKHSIKSFKARVWCATAGRVVKYMIYNRLDFGLLILFWRKINDCINTRIESNERWMLMIGFLCECRSVGDSDDDVCTCHITIVIDDDQMDAGDGMKTQWRSRLPNCVIFKCWMTHLISTTSLLNHLYPK